MTYNEISIIILGGLLIFDLLEPVLRSKRLYFSMIIEKKDLKLKPFNVIYRNYCKKVLLITFPIALMTWYYYPIEKNLFGFLLGFLIMVILNLFFIFNCNSKLN